eukprot:Cvel_29845.t1-p1 / transcript=Cvel_29845.t1 / gene=Cvel_29845 / organism=Chromera_velia_CCMP2878 / gene_product=hypothetical protein / transcript_product=hypothetical protein / location=Cvel_scaffold4161:1047-1739(-) / protein_length=169 / sequence_SO=supercontig / SO=protein_coding / is_pseudo=false
MTLHLVTFALFSSFSLLCHAEQAADQRGFLQKESGRVNVWAEVSRRHSFAERLFRANFDLVQKSLDTSFVKGVGDGTLSEDRFHYYLHQDYLYLQGYAKAHALLASSVPPLVSALAPEAVSFFAKRASTLGSPDHSEHGDSNDTDVKRHANVTRAYVDSLLSTTATSGS